MRPADREGRAVRADKISRTQLMALLWAGVMAPAADLLPALLLPGAGRGAWLAVALAAPLVLAAGWLMDSLAEERGLAGCVTGLLGRWAGGAVLLIYMVWGLLLLMLRLKLCAQRMLSSGERDGAPWFFLLTAAAVLLWIGRGRLSAFARAGQLFLLALLVTGGVVLLLSLFQASPERLLPLWHTEGWGMLRAALSAAGTVGWGLFAAFLMGGVEDQGERKSWHWLFWGLGGMVLLAAAQAVIVGNLGAGLSARLDNPFFALAKSVGVEGAFQRVESVVIALWTFADLSMGGMLLFALRYIGAEILPERAVPWLPWAAVVLAAAGALLLLRNPGDMQMWNQRLVPMGNLCLGVAVPAALKLLKNVREKVISCRRKAC